MGFPEICDEPTPTAKTPKKVKDGLKKDGSPDMRQTKGKALAAAAAAAAAHEETTESSQETTESSMEIAESSQETTESSQQSGASHINPFFLN